MKASKAKLNTPSSQIRRRSNQDLPSPPTWREQIKDMKISEIIGRRTEIIFLAESDRYCADFVDNVDVMAEKFPTEDVVYVKYGCIADMLEAYKANGKNLPERNTAIYKMVLQEVAPLLEESSHLPSEIMAYLVKIKVVEAIEDNIAEEQKKNYMERIKDEEYNKLLTSLESLGNVGEKGKGKGKEKKIEKPGKDKPTKKVVKDEKPSEIIKEECNVTPSEMKQTSHFTQIEAHPEIKVEEKDLYVVLCGFYDAGLIVDLIKVGLPLHTLLEVGKEYSVIHKELMQPVEGEDSDETIRLFHRPSGDNVDERQTVINMFWNQVMEMYYGNKSNNILEEIIHVNFNFGENLPIELSAIEKYKDFINSFRTINDMRRQYNNYISQIKLQNLGTTATNIPLKNLKLYNSLMKPFPPECFTIQQLLESLLQEVCFRVEQTEELEEEKSEEEQDPDVCENNRASTRKQVAELLKNYSKRNQGKSSEAQYSCYRCNFRPSIDLNINTDFCNLHENDRLQKIAHTYKKHFEKLYYGNTNMLKFGRSASLRRMRRGNSDIDRLMNRYNMEVWKNNFDLTQDEVEDIIHIYLANTIKYERDCDEDFEENEDYKLIPHFSKKHLHLMAKPSSIRAFDLSELNKSDECLQIANYLYRESLSPEVLLQKLFEADLKYSDTEYVYSPILDTLLLVFHNSTDEFGCYTKVWNKSLRSMVCLRDFCKFIVHENVKWLQQQEEKYFTERQEEIEKLRELKKEAENYFRSEVELSSENFLVPGSIKMQQMMANKAPPETTLDTKKKIEASKESISQIMKAPLSVAEVEQILITECKSVDARSVMQQPYSFIGYDFGKGIQKLSATTSIFHSLDGVRVTVDRLCWQESEPDLTIKIDCNDHTFVLHKPHKRTPFMFHFSMADEAIVALAKPTRIPPTEKMLCKRICEEVKKSKDDKYANSAYAKKKQEVLFVSVDQDYVVKDIEIPFTTRRNLILSENLMGPFMDTLGKMNIKSHLLISPETLREHQKRRHNLANRIKSKTNVSYDGTNERRKSPFLVRKKSHQIKTIIPKSSSISLTNSVADEFAIYSNEMLSKVDVENMDRENATILKQRKEFLAKLKKAMAKHVPVFKICSSRLHKYHYIRRCKSYLSIPIGNIVKRILYKPKYCKTERRVNVTRCFPLGTIKLPKSKMQYDLRVSLPSGLLIRNTTGIGSEFPCIKQQYIDKGPTCKPIEHEECRIYLRNGTIAKKKCDGSIQLLNLNGNILDFEIPYLIKAKKQTINLKKNQIKKKQKLCPSQNVLVQSCVSDLTVFQKFLQRTLKRQYRHLLSNEYDRYFKSRNRYLRSKKNHNCDPNELYLMRLEKEPFDEFRLLTSDGRQIKVTDRKAVQEQKYYISTETDYRSEETFFEREDGAHGVLNRDGVLETQFPDGTRIKTWFEEDEELIFFTDPASELCSFNTLDKSTQAKADEDDDSDYPDYAYYDLSMFYSIRMNQESLSYAEKPGDGWVLLHIYYEYTHPNYAKVLFGGPLNEMKVTLPNGCEISSNGNGEYKVSLDDHFQGDFSKELILLNGRSCFLCPGVCQCKINIKNLYCPNSISSEYPFVEVEDSYSKTFMVDYNGKCMKYCHEKLRNLNQYNCIYHVKVKSESFFAVRKDFSGIKFWDKSCYYTACNQAKSDPDRIMEVHAQDEKGEESDPIALEFRRYIYKPFHEKYCMSYDEPRLQLSKYRSQEKRKLFYCTQRVIHKLVGFTKAFEIYRRMGEVKKDVMKSDEKFERFLVELEKKVNEERLEECKRKKDEESYREKCSEDVKKEFEPTKSLYEKWYEWQEECKKYKQLIQEQYVPLYFSSKFGEKHRDDEIKTEKHIQSLLQDIINNAVNTSEANKPNLYVKKSKKTSEDLITNTTNIKEEILVASPKDLVILCNHENKQKQNHKLMILTNVSNESKAEIAKQFERITEKRANTFQLDDAHTLVFEASSEPYVSKEASSESKSLSECETSENCTLQEYPIAPSTSFKPYEFDVSAVTKALESISPKKEVIKTYSLTNKDCEPEVKLVDNEDVNLLYMSEVLPVGFNTKRKPVISDNLRAIANKIASVLFENGFINEKRISDKIVHKILAENKVSENDLSHLSVAVKEEILSNGWLDNTNYEIVLKNKATEICGIDQVLRMFAGLIKEKLIKKSKAKKLKEIINLEGVDNYKTNYVVGNVVSSIIKKLKYHSGKLTCEKRLKIVNNILQEVASDLKPQEIDSFCQGLDEAVETEVETIATETTDEKNKVIDSLLQSIKRFKFDAYKTKYPTNETKDSLQQKSVMIPTEPVSSVLEQYTSQKSERKFYFIPLKTAHSFKTIPGQTAVKFSELPEHESQKSKASSSSKINLRTKNVSIGSQSSTSLFKAKSDSGHLFSKSASSIRKSEVAESRVTLLNQHPSATKMSPSMYAFASKYSLLSPTSKLSSMYVAPEDDDDKKDPSVSTANEGRAKGTMGSDEERLSGDYERTSVIMRMSGKQVATMKLMAECARNDDATGHLKIGEKSMSQDIGKVQERLNTPVKSSQSLKPMYASSILRRHEQPFKTKEELGSIDSEDLREEKKTSLFKKKNEDVMYSVGTQTHSGDDVITQTSDWLLPNKWKLGEEYE